MKWLELLTTDHKCPKCGAEFEVGFDDSENDRMSLNEVVLGEFYTLSIFCHCTVFQMSGELRIFVNGTGELIENPYSEQEV